MITVEARYRVLVKIPLGVDIDQFVDLFWDLSWDLSGESIEEVERDHCLDGSTNLLVYPVQDSSLEAAKSIERALLELSKQQGFEFIPL